MITARRWVAATLRGAIPSRKPGDITTDHLHLRFNKHDNFLSYVRNHICEACKCIWKGLILPELKYVHIRRHFSVLLIIKCYILWPCLRNPPVVAAAVGAEALACRHRGHQAHRALPHSLTVKGSRDKRTEAKVICSLCLHCLQPSSQWRQSTFSASATSPGGKVRQAQEKV